MSLKAYSIYDNKAKAFNTPFFMQNDDMAIRAFSNLARDSDSNISKNPEDFVLYSVGAFDDGTGLMASIDPVVNLGLAAQFVKGDKS